VNLTRREKHALTIAVLIIAIISIASLVVPSKDKLNQFLSDWELLYLFFIVAPLGFYIATDPEVREGK